VAYLIVSNVWRAAVGRSQKMCSARILQPRQLSIMSSPYGDNTPTPCDARDLHPACHSAGIADRSRYFDTYVPSVRINLLACAGPHHDSVTFAARLTQTHAEWALIKLSFSGPFNPESRHIHKGHPMPNMRQVRTSQPVVTDNPSRIAFGSPPNLSAFL
jgi:hypothetical protein